MPTTVVKTIGSGGDYSTLQAAEDAKPANLVTADQIWQMEMLAGTNISVSGNALTISGSTTDSTRYTVLKCAAGASFRDHASKQTNPLRWSNTVGASIAGGDNYTDAVVVGESFCRLQGLQIKGNSTNVGHMALGCTQQNIDVDGCIVESASTAVLSNNTGFKMRNTLCIRTTSGGVGISMQTNFTLVNVTVVKPSDVGTIATGISGTYLTGSSTVTNCAVFGFTTCATTSGNITYASCKTDQSSPPTGFTTATYSTSLFANITNATKDYRVVSGSALIDAGTTDSTNAATDILGVSRPQGASYDVGAHEFSSASVPTITDFGDESHRVGEVGVTITGTNFGSSQGTGFVKISPTDDINNANAVTQTVSGTWTDTSIPITIVRGSSVPLPLFTNLYLFVQNDSASSNAAGYVHQLTAPVAALANAIRLYE